MLKGCQEMNQNALQVFNYQNTEIRTVGKDGEVLFVANDLCQILSIDSTQVRRLDEDEKGLHLIQTPGGNQQMTVVNESGLYALILKSRKPEAKKFRKWVTSEVLPAIRKTGKYEVAPQHHLPTTFSEALKLAYEQAIQIETMQPKVEAFDALLDTKNSMTMNQAAKTLETGRNRLFEFLRAQDILMSSGPNLNLPAQRYIDDGYFTVRLVTITHSDWSETKSQTLVTAKGLEYIRKKLNDSIKAKAA